MIDGTTTWRSTAWLGTAKAPAMSPMSFGTARTPSATLLMTNGTDASTTTTTGVVNVKPNHSATNSAQTTYGMANPPYTKSRSTASNRRDSPMATPITLPIVSDNASPTPSLA